MTLRSIAYKNIKGNLNKYIMYYLSNTLVVMVFFIFANFIFNPEVKNIKTMGNLGLLSIQIMYLCEFIILTFTVVFTLYSISTFLKSRAKEFGLLSMFGLTKSEIRNYIMFENLIVSLASIATGIVFGALFSKLFFMAISAILKLNLEIPFSISTKALIITLVCFIILFQLIGFVASHNVKNNNIIELLKGSRIAKPSPEFSKYKAILSIILIFLGYIIAASSSTLIILTMFPILILVVTGTYLLYSQFSVYFTNKLQENKLIYYKGINMITLSQIIYKLKDNAKILFIVSILSSVTLTASSCIYSLQKSMQKEIQLNSPQDISFIESGLNSHDIIIPEEIESILNSSDHNITFKSKVILIKALNTDDSMNNSFSNKKDFYIMSNSEYNILATEFEKTPLNLNYDDIVIHSYSNMNPKNEKLFSNIKYLNLDIEGFNEKFKIKDEIIGGIINSDEKNANIAIINDSNYEKILNRIPDESKYVYYGYNINDWINSSDIVSQIKSMVSKDKETMFNERVLGFLTFMNGMSLFFFIGTFIAILFFIATGSILYFKMFTEIQKDKQEFISLKKMGMSKDEVKTIISIQCFIMFFLPFVVAFSHTAFAIKSLSNLLGESLSIYLLTIVAIYLLLQTSYYFFSKSIYTKQINNWEL
ncbi:FtsX-like permease family protein [Clostridium senegalense]|uniref:ABC transporter permease n=1 Tax=Clostridium senegalense TaxID=1465809 RepID=A0A6M0H2H0_9CLOT|nr:ABC transporter permease [Clostridium senegalense]NEU04293.1 ABC transporter permease [Clostridium senegalense]